MPLTGQRFGTAKTPSTDELHGTVRGCPKAYAVQASASAQQALAEISSFDQPSALSQPVITREATGVLHPIYFVLVSNHNTRIIQRADASRFFPTLSSSGPRESQQHPCSSPDWPAWFGPAQTRGGMHIPHSLVDAYGVLLMGQMKHATDATFLLTRLALSLLSFSLLSIVSGI